MASYFTTAGIDACLKGGASDGGFARLAARLRLYDSTSTPNINGTGFAEVANGNGYVTGGVAITQAEWTAETSGNRRIRLADKMWTAAGGSIANVSGAYITDAVGNVLAWFEEASAVTVLNGDTFTVQNLAIGIA